MGLKGTDGLAERARELGASEQAHVRAREALNSFLEIITNDPHWMKNDTLDGGIDSEERAETGITIWIAGEPMGETLLNDVITTYEKENGLLGVGVRSEDPQNNAISSEIIMQPDSPTSSLDTIKFCRLAREHGAEIILFAGGDGTARDVVEAVGEDFPILGIPSGVKMHSGVFTVTPAEAGRSLMEFLNGTAALESREVVDLDEESYRSGVISTRVYGYASVPMTTSLQGCKNIISGVEDEPDRRAIADGLEEFMDQNPGIYILGAGSTLKDIGSHLGAELTPLGFDILLISNESMAGGGKEEGEAETEAKTGDGDGKGKGAVEKWVRMIPEGPAMRPRGPGGRGNLRYGLCDRL